MPFFEYPLNMRFKLIALAPRIYVTDANGIEQLFVHQKTWKFREDILIYSNSNKERVVFRIRADRVIDFSATYRFYLGEDEEQTIGCVKRKGMRSLWRATYFTDDAMGVTTHHMKEDNPWTKVMDGMLPDIISGYFFNPSYTIYRGEDRDDETQPVMSLKKQKAFWESKYEVHLDDPAISQVEEFQCLLSILMMLQLERRRG